MDVKFINPGAEEMIRQILEFQTPETSVWWSSPLYHFYPQLDQEYAQGLAFPERMAYLEQMLQKIYEEQRAVIDQKAKQYADHWTVCRGQITEALSEAFEVDLTNQFQDLRCLVSLNPVEPRFLQERSFSVFYLNSGRGAIGEAIHEIVHFVWFYVWHQVFGDRVEEYERPSTKWILSEMVVESVMRDPRLSSINPYFPRENGGCIYPWFFDMIAGGKPILETLDPWYRSMGIRDFMKKSYEYCLEHEDEIRGHMNRAETAEI